MPLTVAIGGLGTIGLAVARALDSTSGPAGVEGLRLVAVSARNLDKAAANLAGFADPPEIVELEELAARADIVVEAASGAVFERIAVPALRGRAGVRAVLGGRAAAAHAPGGAGAADRRRASSCRPARCWAWTPCAPAPRGRWRASPWKPAGRRAGLAGAPYLAKHNIDVLAITAPACVFEGNAVDAAAGFPGQRQRRRRAGAGRHRPGAHAGGDLGRPGGGRAAPTPSGWRPRRRG